MRKVLFFALMLLVSAGCYDDSALWDSVKDHESRIVKLEELCAKMNSDISSLQTLLDAVQKRDYITSVVPVMQGSDEIGYTIVFSSGQIITIYHGKDGADGQNGNDGKDGINGKDGSVPVIGVRMDTDGVYYWTVDGEWLLDSEGNRIRAVGRDGKDGADGADGQDGKDGADGSDGQDGSDGKDGENGKDGQNGTDGTDGLDGKDGEDGVTPILKIEEGYWYVSYDDEQTWTILGKAVEEPDGCYLFEDVYQEDGFVYFTLKSGDVITVPFKSELSISLVEDMTPALGYTMKMSYTITGATGTTELAVMCEGGWTSSVRPVSGTTGEILLTAPLPYRDGKCVVLVNDNGLNIMKNVDLAPVIEFKDEVVGAEMVRRYDQDKDGQLSLKEAAEVTSDVFRSRLPETATSFDEFKYFTSVTDLYDAILPNTLESVILPESITYIHEVAFSDLKSLKSINIPKNVKIIGFRILSGCTSMEEIHIHSLSSWLDIDFGSPYDNGLLFNGDDGVSPVLIDRNGDVIRDVVIPDHIATIKEGPFSYIGIESVTLHSGVNAIESGAFEGCKKLKKICVDDLNHWMKISHEFWYDKSSYPSLVDKNGVVMDDIVIPDGTETIPSHMFAGLGIKNVTVPSSVTSIEAEAFSGCGELLSVKIPASVKTIGIGAFYGCTSVETVYVESIEDWLSIDFATGFGSNPLYASSTAGNNPRLADYDGKTLNLSVIPEGTTVIETSAYAGLADLESIVIPSTVTRIGDYAFAGCTNLKTITIPESVKEIGECAFAGCVSVQRVNIPSVDHWVSSIWFNGAHSNPLTESALNGNSPVLVDDENNVMTSIGVKDGTTGLGAGPYCGLTGMTEIIIPASVTSIGSNPFAGCVNLKKITVPASVTYIDDYVFRGMTNLKEIVFLGGITEIQMFAFMNCTNLTDITIPPSVVSIENFAFYGCTSLKNVSLSEGLQSIGQLAFHECNSLEEITIPASVNTLIGAFLSCENLSTIYVKNPVPPSTDTWDIVFHGCPSMTKIYVPRESVDAYKSAFGWSSHADLIEGYDF